MAGLGSGYGAAASVAAAGGGTAGAVADEDEPKVLVGNLIGEDHVNYVLMYNMLTGIRIGVSRCQAKIKRALTDEDYQAKHKFTFDIIGNELTPSAKYDFKFKDYAPWVFRELREYFHLDAADYLLSLTAKYILSELGSPGKSGSFFYFSRDYRFIIKTIRHSEHKFLLRILKDYHEHVKANPHTLLSRFYGLHRVKLPRGRKIHFVIMNNLFPPHRDIHETYDLKGSIVGREYDEEKAKLKRGAVLKDINWLRRERKIELGPEKRAIFEAQLKSDVALLARLNIMDYSLLIGLHDMRRGNRENLRQEKLQMFQPDTTSSQMPKLQHVPSCKNKRLHEKEAFALRAAVRRSDPKSLVADTQLPTKDSSERRHFVFYQDEGGFRSTNEANEPTGWIYYLGVIDLFTPYTSVKRGETWWKSFTQDRHLISSVPPKEYADRFFKFMMMCTDRAKGWPGWQKYGKSYSNASAIASADVDGGICVGAPEGEKAADAGEQQQGGKDEKGV
ncbi:SAICAR synthase-like protein [Tilletiaria anomala UBC 951]|uniref:1-phosphatidylinositol-4-phosphate 5-kinase n=1 Tax=Tilletiaria anomala (strain ATCC 24038 / CBS 436.72 / UBC 951) TaxID=1037660 RepID=A0A066WH55_TILAU|nr:SAICAR synthase-like protein [Tilletiaria anomala UBC 951]KDN50359.1 SAICAR synthase-like protein [Tilletiaria anomala UBC 951]